MRHPRVTPDMTPQNFTSRFKQGLNHIKADTSQIRAIQRSSRNEQAEGLNHIKAKQAKNWKWTHLQLGELLEVLGRAEVGARGQALPNFDEGWAKPGEDGAELHRPGAPPLRG